MSVCILPIKNINTISGLFELCDAERKVVFIYFRDTISSSFKGTDRGAILTTHYMEEADALCNRVGIMVNGQLE